MKHDDLQDLEELDPWDWPRRAGTRIAEGLRSPDSATRLRAAELAGHLFEDEGVVLALADAVAADPDPEVRALAAVALGPALEDCDTAIEVPGASPVSRDAFERACRVLEAAWADETNSVEVRRRALEGAVRSPRPWQEAAIRAACAHDDPLWRTSGTFAAAWYPALGQLALAALDDPDVDVRAEAVLAVGRLGAKDRFQHVLSLAKAKDTPPQLLLAAIDALGELGVQEAEPVLTRLARSKDEEVAEAAAAALDELAVRLDLQAEIDEPEE
jgi:HEAT repeat protein